jgi:DNA ligase (NAD+)
MINISDLEQKIKLARDAYYNLDPIMSDEEYDALIDTLKDVKPESPEVKEVGYFPSSNEWGKETHIDPMGSLNKVNSTDEFLEWASWDDQYLITHKLDGLSLEVIYSDGQLLKAVTRGDGYTGENVTVNARYIKGISRNFGRNIRIRGEVILPVDIFLSKYSDTYANPRNAAAGMLRDRKNGSELCKDLKFISFWSSEEHQSHEKMFRKLESDGFYIPDYLAVSNKGGVVELFQQSVSMRSSLPYEIDGMVIYLNDMTTFLGLGSKDRRPEGAIAWKYAAQAKVTKLTDIRWSVGPTGRVNPIAVVEPVNIGGVTITNVSLQNYANFKSMNLKEGSLLLISRKNDVIPYVEGVVSDSE